MSDRVVVAVFEHADAAHEAAIAIKALQHQKESDFKLKAGAMVTKDDAGQLAYSKEKDRNLLGTTVGAVSGALIGLLSLPVGVIGAAVGATLGMTHDMAQEGFDSHFLDAVAAEMRPGTVALVLEVKEQAPGPVDDIITRSGGKTYRQPLQ